MLEIDQALKERYGEGENEPDLPGPPEKPGFWRDVLGGIIHSDVFYEADQRRWIPE